jgi:hypothetical protein
MCFRRGGRCPPCWQHDFAPLVKPLFHAIVSPRQPTPAQGPDSDGRTTSTPGRRAGAAGHAAAAPAAPPQVSLPCCPRGGFGARRGVAPLRARARALGGRGRAAGALNRRVPVRRAASRPPGTCQRRRTATASKASQMPRQMKSVLPRQGGGDGVSPSPHALSADAMLQPGPGEGSPAYGSVPCVWFGVWFGAVRMVRRGKAGSACGLAVRPPPHPPSTRYLAALHHSHTSPLFPSLTGDAAMISSRDTIRQSLPLIEQLYILLYNIYIYIIIYYNI